MSIKEIAPNHYILPTESELSKMITHSYKWFTPKFSPRDVPRFADVSSMTESPATMKGIRDFLVQRYRDMGHSGPTHILGFDARGFLFGPMIAVELGIPFVLMRKAEKNAGLLVKSEPYEKEYKEAAPEVMTIRYDSIGRNSRVVLIDDVLATGGTAISGLQLVEACGASVVEVVTVTAIVVLGAVEKIHNLAEGRYRNVRFLTLTTEDVLLDENCADVQNYSGPRVISYSDAIQKLSENSHI